MSASPEPQAGSRAASPEQDDAEKVVTPGAAQDDEGEQENSGNQEGDGLGGLSDDNDDAVPSDDESILSEVDEAQFDNFDPENVEVDDRPQLAIDEENLKLIGRHKRKRAEGEEGRSRKKEGRREKKRRGHDDEDEDAPEGSSARRERKKKAASPDTDEETMDPETRMCSYIWLHYVLQILTAFCSLGRRRALDRAMDEAMKKPVKRRGRKQDGIVGVL